MDQTPEATRSGAPWSVRNGDTSKPVSATHHGALMGHQPTVTSIELRTVDAHPARDGEIITSTWHLAPGTWHLEDTAEPMRQLDASADGATSAARCRQHSLSR